MSEVSCRTCVPLVEAVRRQQLPAAELLRGLPYTLDSLARPSNRIPWSDYTRLLENGSRLLGGPESLEDVAMHYYEKAGGILGAVASRVWSARPLYHMGARWYGPSLYSSTRASCEDLPDGRIRQTIEILPGYRDSVLFFHAMRGGLRGIPILLGQPCANVEMEIAPRLGVFIIEPPAHLSAWARLRRSFSWSSALERADEEFDVQREELQRGYELARKTSRRLDVQTRKLDEERLERERAEQLLLQAQKLETVGRLAGGIAHDFNNVLTSITGYAELAEARLKPGDPLAEDLDEIRSVTQRGASLVRQLLSFSRPRPSTPDVLELNSVISGMESMLTRLIPESIQLVIVPSCEPIRVFADPGQLEQVIVNLVVNSRDAMPGGGRITIEIGGSSTSELGVSGRSEPAGPWGRILVRDTGRGMDSKTLGRAFEPFFTTKARGKGSGLGLATVQRIVSQSGGAIRLESAVGRGTSVAIELPAGPPDSRRPRPRRAEDPLPGGQEAILVVEHDREMRALVRRTLEERGYSVLTAEDAEEALEVTRTHPGPIELLVTDRVLRSGDGSELARRVDALRPELRGAVFLSREAIGRSPTPEAPLPAHRVHLARPVDPPALLRAVRRVLDS